MIRAMSASATPSPSNASVTWTRPVASNGTLTDPSALTLLEEKVVYFEHSGVIRDAVAQLYQQLGRKADAVARGRELAGNKRAELIIKDEAGRVSGKDSRGKDPRRIRG